MAPWRRCSAVHSAAECWTLLLGSSGLLCCRRLLSVLLFLVSCRTGDPDKRGEPPLCHRCLHRFLQHLHGLQPLVCAEKEDPDKPEEPKPDQPAPSGALEEACLGCVVT